VAGLELNCARHTYSLRDVWKKTRIGTTADGLAATIAPHDVLMLRLIH
jgi:hypothetical protein